jgi:hypothetical protein
MKCAVHPEIEAVGACCSCGRFVCPECKALIDGQIYCNRCVAARLDTGAWPGQATAPASFASGMGSNSAVPPEIRGWNWGGFLMTWIWGIGNNVWISFIALLGIIPWVGWIISLTMRIILGAKGNEWAWQHKKWDSIEHFKRTQRTWLWWGIGLIVLEIVMAIAVIVLIASLYMIGVTVDKYPNWRDMLPKL